MARIKLAYIGGGSTRAPGTMTSLIHQGENFSGSEIVLIDQDAERLGIVERLSRNMAASRAVDLTIRSTTNRAGGLADCDAVLSSYRPGGFQARQLDESIPLRHGVIGQETQGPGGFFMALRSIAVMQSIVRDMERVCPQALLVNYTNPVNIVAQAVTAMTGVRVVSLCEGPIIFPRMVARAAGLDPGKVDAVMIGINHGSWSVSHRYEDRDFVSLVRSRWEARDSDLPAVSHNDRLLWLTSAMGSIPADYFLYYYFTNEILAELQEKPTTRAQDILAGVPDYWDHYREQASSSEPELDPGRSRGGLNELELAVDVLDAYFNDRDEIWPVNVTNNGAIQGLDHSLVVEVQGRIRRSGIEPVPSGPLPQQTRGLVDMLAEYQVLTAHVALEGDRRAGIQALAANPLVLSLRKATEIYDEMSAAHADLLPARLLR